MYGHHIWVTNEGNNTVTEVNAATGAFVANLSGGDYDFSDPRALAFDGHHVWVANRDANSLTVLPPG